MSLPNETTTGMMDEQEGLIEVRDSLNLNLDEDRVRQIVRDRIDRSQSFWEKELNIKQVREDNYRRWKNENLEVGSNSTLYKFQVPYRDNRIFLSVETLVSQLVPRIPIPEIIEAEDTDASRELANKYGMVLIRTAEDMKLKGKLQHAVRHLLMGYRSAVVKYYWDFEGGRLKKDGTYTGVPQAYVVDPNRLVFDAYTQGPDRMPMIAELMSGTVEEVAYKFPDKKDEFLKSVIAANDADQGAASPINYWEVWFTFYDSDGNKREGVCMKYQDVILDFGLNPNFNYGNSAYKTNFFPQPRKPYIPIRVYSTGKWIYDETSLTEQSATLQDVLEKRGRQIVENADSANSGLVFNTMMISAAEAQKYVGDPKQHILVKGRAQDAVNRVAPALLPDYVLEDKYDARREIDNIFGTHAPLRGEKTNSQTLGQELLSQKSDSGRTNPVTEALEVASTELYQGITQLYKVYAEEESIIQYLGEDGHTVFINFSQDKIEDGLQIRIQSGSLNPDDKISDRNEAIELAKIGGRIDPLTFAEKWHLPNPRQFATRLVHFLWQPDRYLEEDLKDSGDQQAGNVQSIIERINSGENVPPPQNISKDYIATYRTYLLTPAFKQLPREIQQLHIAHLRAAITAAQEGLKQPQQQQPNLLTRLFGGANAGKNGAGAQAGGQA